MSSTNTNTFAATQSEYLNSLINYVLDIKPYHTKLAATGAVSEGYLFSDTINVNIAEKESLVVFMGADLMPATAVPGGGRARLSQTWWRDIVSDGSTYTWPLPLISVPVFQSEANLQNFKCGLNDYTGIVGLPLGVFNPKRWDGPGITDVERNGVHQQDTINYALSYGAYSVDIEAGGNWVEHDITNVSAFGTTPGTLAYDILALSGGTITVQAATGNYEEWVVTTIYTDPMGVNPAQASVTGSVSGNVGTAFFNQQFISPQISFFWGYAPGESVETTEIGASFTGSIVGNILTVTGAVTGRPNGIAANTILTSTGVASGTTVVSQLTGSTGLAGTYVVDIAQSVLSTTMLAGDTWILTPASKVTVLPSAPVETWSVIKSNPIALTGAPVFVPAVARTDTPAIEVHARSLDWTNQAATWTITFAGNGTYSLNRSPGLSPNGISYPITVDLVNGCSFANADIAFTIIPTATGWNAGDAFEWSVGSSTANYKVYGSISGWQADAAQGEWYWNGIIGFKIPRLTYFMVGETINFTALKPVASYAEPSVYTVTITSAGEASVFNNIYGYRQGLTIGQPWADEYASFQIDQPNSGPYTVGQTISIFLSPPYTYAASDGYEVQPYEIPPYDAGNFNLTVPYLYDAELFPLFAHHGAVVWFKSSGIGTSLSIGDAIVIDKSFVDTINLNIAGSHTNYPELGATSTGWVPIKLKYFDNVNPASLSNGTYTPTSPANYSDLATYIQGYTAADPNRLVFSIMSPRYLKTDRSAYSTLVFDQTFFTTYLPFNTHYSIQVQPDEVYGQHIRVKFTENLKIYALIYLDVSDTITTVIVDDPVGYLDIITDIWFAEGPVTGYWGYDPDLPAPHLRFISPVQPTDPVFTYPFAITVTDVQSTKVDEATVDSSPTSVVEGLQIMETTISTDPTSSYDESPYDAVTIDIASAAGNQITLGYLEPDYSFYVVQGTQITQGSITDTVQSVNGNVLTMTNSDGWAVGSVDSITPGASYVDGSYYLVPLIGGHGSGAQANITVSGGGVIAVTIVNYGTGYTNGDSLTATNNFLGGSGSGFAVEVLTWQGGFATAYIMYDSTLPIPEYEAGETRLSTVFDFNILQPVGWVPPPTAGSEGFGLLLPAANEYLVTMVNTPVSVSYPPNLIIESAANPGTYGNPVPNTIPIYPQEPSFTSASSFTFTLPPGFTAPFRLWIV